MRRRHGEAATAHGADVLWPSPHPTWPSVRISAALLSECPRIGRCEMCSPEATSCITHAKTKGRRQFMPWFHTWHAGCYISSTARDATDAGAFLSARERPRPHHLKVRKRYVHHAE